MNHSLDPGTLSHGVSRNPREPHARINTQPWALCPVEQRMTNAWDSSQQGMQWLPEHCLSAEAGLSLGKGEPQDERLRITFHSCPSGVYGLFFSYSYLLPSKLPCFVCHPFWGFHLFSNPQVNGRTSANARLGFKMSPWCLCSTVHAV